MTRIARYGRSVAKDGATDELAEILLEAANALADDAGCELYLINRQATEPNVIWVTEVWRSQEDLDAAVERIRGSEGVAAAMKLAESWEVVELELLGGKGLPAAT